MQILALDCSHSRGSLCWLDSGKEIFYYEWQRNQSHAEILFPSLIELLQKHHLKLENLNLLAINIGPGSFTGIRVGLNFIKSLAYSLQIPIFTADSLELSAYSNLEKCKSLQSQNSIFEIHCLLNANRNQFYYKSFKYENSNLEALCEAGLKNEEEILKPWQNQNTNSKIIISDCPELLTESFLHFCSEHKILLDQSIVLTNARSLAHLALSRPLQTIDWKMAQALYIRPSSAEEKLRKV